MLHVGEAENPALRDYLALGAAQIEVIAAGADLVSSLAEKLKHTDLILTGSRAENGEDSGLLPYLLAARLNVPVVNNVLAVTALDSRLELLQFLPKAKRRRISVALPAVIAMHPLAAVALRYAHSRKEAGSISTSCDDHAQPQTAWKKTPAKRMPIKLVAQERTSGHERMMAAISSEAKGGKVVFSGSCVEKAQVVLSYLREHQLVNF